MSREPKDPLHVVEPLAAGHDRSAFDCGQEALNRYLKQQASQDARRGAAAPFVAVEPGSRVVQGYYTLSMSAIDLTDLPLEAAKSLPKYPIVPAVLLGRLAVDRSRQGTGLGSFLLIDEMERGLRNEISWVAIVVDAIDDTARSFYEHFGFTLFPDHPSRLFIMRKTVEKAIPPRA